MRNYSAFVRSCMRFYARYPNPVFHSDVNRENWEACEKALQTFPAQEQEQLISLYLHKSEFDKSLTDTATELKIKTGVLRKLNDKLEELIAKEKRLI